MGAVALVAAAGCDSPGESGSEAVLGTASQAVMSAPDFVVSSIAGPASVMPGQQFTTTVTVCNQGTVSASTMVELYLSSDATITPGPSSPDFYLGNISSGYLNPGQCQAVVAQQSVYSYGLADGAYYLGAAADVGNYTAELSETNNIKLGNRLGVGNKPDFIVSSVTGPVSATLGQPLTATVTVCNQGTQGGSAPLEVYLSADTTITPNGPSGPSTDVFVGYANTQYLNAGQCQTVAVQGSAYVPSEGAYYLGAYVDPQNSMQELIEDNNAKAGTRLGIGYKPDFTVSSVTGPVSATPSQQLTATVKVCNQGTQGGSAPLEVYLSADTTITPNGPSGPSPDSFVGYANTQYLNPGQCQTLTVQGSAYVPSEGAYYLGAYVDPPNSSVEFFETNNAKAGTRMGIGYKPDFIVSSVTGPASATPSQQLTATVTVCNQGTQGGSAPVEVYLSADATITPNGPSAPSTDVFVGYGGTPYLNPGQCQTVAVQGSAYVPSEGPYYLGAYVDPQNFMQELIDDNNAKTGARMGIGNRPDFTVSAVTGPASATPSQQFTPTVTVCNQGTQGGSTNVELYLSADTAITPMGPGYTPDFLAGNGNTQYLNPGQCQTLSVQGWVNVPTDGVYYLGAYVDPQGYMPELIEDNNTRATQRIGIGYKPDFVVSAATSVSSARMGQTLTATVTVCNQGTQSGSTWLELYLSPDTTITAMGPGVSTPDFFLAYGSTPTLNPGQCQTLILSGPASVPSAGSYYLGAVVDPSNGQPELIDDNNIKVGTLVSLTP